MSIIDRMIRAARLDASLYEDVEANPGLMREAMIVVILSAVAAGIGNIWSGGLGGLIGLAIGALVSWFIWAYLSYWIGVRLLPEPGTKADAGQLLRAIGFASSPGLIRVVGIIPGLAKLSFFVAAVWMLVAMVVAVRQALDYTSTGRAVGVVAIGWIVQLVVIGALMRMLGFGF